MGKWLVVALVLVAVAVQVEATFASSTGFSGRNADCTVCHAPAAAAATAHLDGAPETWRPGETYALRLAVTGGPLAMPAPQPQGGFELEVEAGTVGPGTGMAGLLRFPTPTVATYEPQGTLRRDWSIAWTAPDAHQPPTTVTFWLAVMSANGNHVIATNTTDGGEQGDAVATLQWVVTPAPEVVAAWEALPLAAPVVERLERVGDGVRIIGYHADGNATHLGYRVAGGPWKDVEAEGEWRLRINGDAALVELRSAGHGRVSHPVPATSPAQATPYPAALLFVVLAGAALGWRPTPDET